MAKGDACEICGNTNGVFKSRKNNMLLCENHRRQIYKFGEVKRTKFDPNEIIIHKDYAELILYDNNGNEKAKSIIDIDDIEKIKNYKWGLDSKGYVKRNNESSKTIKLHNYIMGYDCDDNYYYDHIDRNPLNNRKSNLRVCTKQQNTWNRSISSRNTTGTPGLYFKKSRNKWTVTFRINGKSIQIGSFKTKEEAISARKEAELKYYGEFSIYNNENERSRDTNGRIGV